MIIVGFFRSIGSDIYALARNEPSDKGVRGARINALMLRIFGLLTVLAAVAAISVATVFTGPLPAVIISIVAIIAAIFGWEMCVMGDMISQMAAMSGKTYNINISFQLLIS